MHLGFATFGPGLMYVGAIIAILLSIFWRPQAGLYYLIPLIPIQTGRYWLHAFPYGEKLVDFVLLAVLIGLLIHSKRPILVSSPLNKWIVIFCVLIYFSLWQGAFYLGGAMPFSFDDPRFSDWKNYVEMMLLFFFAASTIRTKRQIQIVIGLMFLSVLIVNRSYHGTVGGRDFSAYSDSLRDAGALGYAGENGMGAFQAEMAILFIGLSAFFKQWKVKIALLLLAATSIYCLAVTFSRGGYLGFLFGLLVLGLAKNRKLLIALVIILASWQSFVPNAVRERVLMTYSAGDGLDSSAEERIGLWQDALEVFNHNPIFGTGFDTYKFMGRVGPYQDTHNYYVKVLLELGFVGLGLFLTILYVTFRMSWNLFRGSDDPLLQGLGCSFVAMLGVAVVVNFFGDRWTYLQVNGFFWILAGMVARGFYIVAQSHEAMESETATLTFDSSPLAEKVSVL